MPPPPAPSAAAASHSGRGFPYGSAALTAVAAITLVRWLVLAKSGLGLYGDEAQYWSWAQHPAPGYFSKPPLVAWVIAATTALCGDGEPCVRAAAPLVHGATSLVLFALARLLYDRRIAFWTAVTFATLPAVSLSSMLISTDVPLLFFWSMTLLFLARTFETRAMGYALGAGLCLGLGLFSKYAMAYIVPCALVFCLMEPKARWFVASRQAALALAAATAVIAPNLFWNIEHGFVTFAHTAANAAWSGSLFHPGHALEFLGAQFAVAGPILFAAFLWLVVRFRPAAASYPESFLIAFSAPVVIIVLVQAFLSRAHANWAAPAFAAGTVLAVAWLAQAKRAIWLKASLGLHVAAVVVLYGLALAPPASLPFADPFARLRGWSELAAALGEKAAAQPGTAVLADDRMVMAELLYYLRGRPVTVVMWDEGKDARNQFEMTAGLSRAKESRFLLVSESPDTGRMAGRFRSIGPAETLVVPLPGGRSRLFYLFDLEDPEPGDARNTRP
ncbi:MAG: glycosyltransferase family 39 protein [Alphaproteobacteria bacterium]